MTISDAEIVRALGEYGFSPNAAVREKIRRYIAILLQWNKRVSLTTVTDPKEILRFHFGESIYAATQGLFQNGRLADVGAGAGFPGAALGLAESRLRVVLMEPNLKKCVFLSEVKRQLELENVEVLRTRMEDYEGEPFDFVTSRALGHFEDLLSFARRNLVREGQLVLWLVQDDARELISAHRGWYWKEPIAIPGAKRRCIVVGKVV
jgi:16S rRNA (guanine527-N7)-methyltransferase